MRKTRTEWKDMTTDNSKDGKQIDWQNEADSLKAEMAVVRYHVGVGTYYVPGTGCQIRIQAFRENIGRANDSVTVFVRVGRQHASIKHTVPKGAEYLVDLTPWATHVAMRFGPQARASARVWMSISEDAIDIVDGALVVSMNIDQ